MDTQDKNAELLESFVMPAELSLFTRCQNQMASALSSRQFRVRLFVLEDVELRF
jgi:hypothetical protein